MVMIQPAVESFYNLVCGIFINLENCVAGEEGTGELGATTIQTERILYEPWNSSPTQPSQGQAKPSEGKFKKATDFFFQLKDANNEMVRMMRRERTSLESRHYHRHSHCSTPSAEAKL